MGRSERDPVMRVGDMDGTAVGTMTDGAGTPEGSTAGAALPSPVGERRRAQPADNRSGTRAEELRTTLERMILEGTLAPGERLDEVELARRFGVSRTPVREAIKSLMAMGLVDARGRQGTSVATLSVGMLLEMFELMAALEGLCAGLAARRATPHQLARMREIQVRLTQAWADRDPGAFYAINAEFHDVLYEASHTEFLAAQAVALRRRLAPYRRGVTWQPGRMRATLPEHEAIIDGIEAGAPDRARAAAEEHLRLLGDQLSDFIASVTKPALR